MKIYFLLLMLCWSSQYSFAQKKAIDSNTYKDWSILNGDPLISNDGKFMSYRISIGLEKEQKMKQVIQSINRKDWKIELMHISRHSSFTSDSKYYLFQTINDSLVVINLTTKSVEYIPQVVDFDLPEKGGGEWLLYKQKARENTLILKNLKTNKERVFTNSDYGKLSEDGSSLVLKQSLKDGKHELILVTLNDGKTQSIWSLGRINEFILDSEHDQLAFNTDSCIWYFKFGMSEPVCVFSKENTSISGNRSRSQFYLRQFSREGDVILLSVTDSLKAKPIALNKAPEIWSYRDITLQKLQEARLSQSSKSFLAAIRISDHEFIQLQHDGEWSFDEFNHKMLFNYGKTFGVESFWNKEAQIHSSIVDTRTGQRKYLDFSIEDSFQEGHPVISPDGKYLVYFDIKKNEYVSCDLTSYKTVNLTDNIKTSWMTHDAEISRASRGVAGWLPQDEAVLVYDSHDIWKLDLKGRTSPENITNGYGLKHKIIFSIALDHKGKIINKNEMLILSAFDPYTKDNGFFRKDLNDSGNPLKLFMGAYLFKIDSKNANSVYDFTPVKSRDKQIYLLKRQSADDAPNYFWTSDFKIFNRLTNIQPQKEYNWFTSELHKWKSLRGEDLQGILYKPENFDPNKKYPVIFYYYEKLSDGLHSFLNPEFNRGRLDIPTYVSNGYLVFCPDIKYVLGDPMQGAYDAIVSAANYVSSFSFVDSKKLGLQGHSFGAIQTNYLVTHTNLFAAACSASGIADWISAYGALPGEKCLSGNFEGTGQNRMVKSIWGNLSGYLNSSPILYVDKVTTPLLLMHTKKDDTCPYENILEFFMALRRLGKKAWMLVYSEGDHTLSGKESKDFTIRMQQFFDHYMKDKPAPLWMLNGVSAGERAFGAGTQLDTSGRTPGIGLLTVEQQKEVDSTSNIKSKAIPLK